MPDGSFAIGYTTLLKDINKCYEQINWPFKVTGKSAKMCGVSAAFKAGLSNDFIRLLGRWKSVETPQFYRDVDPANMRALGEMMAKTFKTNSNSETDRLYSTPSHIALGVAGPLLTDQLNSSPSSQSPVTTATPFRVINHNMNYAPESSTQSELSGAAPLDVHSPPIFMLELQESYPALILPEDRSLSLIQDRMAPLIQNQSLFLLYQTRHQLLLLQQDEVHGGLGVPAIPLAGEDDLLVEAYSAFTINTGD